MKTGKAARRDTVASQSLERRAWQGEFRAADEEGVIEGYVTKWGTLDSYGSMFQRGAFTKTLQERAKKVRVLWNHEEEPIGVPVELREDEVGLFARLRLVLSVRRARETYDLVKAGAIDSFSFGFRTIKDAWVDGVRQIKEVALFEVSPVIFPANESAQITGVRHMDGGREYRAEDFAATYQHTEMPRRHWVLMDALQETLMDIFWTTGPGGDGFVDKMGEALDKFSAAYRQYVAEYAAAWGNEETRSHPASNELARAMRETMSTRADNSPEALAADTSLTVAEVRTLLRGGVGVAPAKLADLPDEVRKAYAKERSTALERVCAELRAGISPAERERLNGLLNPRDAAVERCEHTRQALEMIESFRRSLAT